MQGTYVFAPTGELLARRNSNRPDDIAAIMRKALAEWEPSDSQDATGIEEAAIRPRFRWEDSYPARGLVLQRYARDLPASGDPSALPARRFNPDAVWFTAAEARTWLPVEPRPGATRELPAAIVERMARLVIVDNARGQTIPYHASEVAGSELKSEVVAIDGDRIELRISGATRAVAKGPWLLGENYWKPKTEWPHSISTRMLGSAVFDRRANRFTEFDLVALGRRHGRTIMNGRQGDDGSGPIGFVLRLAPANWKVAPTFINVYDVDWVKQPAVEKDG